MLHKGKAGCWESTMLAGLGFVRHGFSTKGDGDMRDKTRRNHFFADRALPESRAIGCEQIHSGVVSRAIDTMYGSVLAKSDGLFWKGLPGMPVPLLWVLTADCVPLVLVDARSKAIAIIHAGWRGTLDHIAEHAVAELKKGGSDPADLYVAVGPRIGRCCYDVPQERAEAFLRVFGNDERIASQDEGQWRIDVATANIVALVQCGVLREHIDAQAMCTRCQSAMFYSYRRDTKETFGEMIAFVTVDSYEQ